MMNSIDIRMLGTFSLEANGVTLSDSGNRSRKVWCLLAYLLCNRSRVVSQKTLIDLLWGADTGSENPDNALRITLHRLRGLLDRLWPGAGMELIVHRDGGYCWNSEHPVTIDCDRFEALVNRPMEDEDALLEDYLEALELYHGEFLPKYSGEFWVIPLSTHFHTLYLQTSMTAAKLLMDKQRYDKALAICRRAAAAEPYHEPLHRQLMVVLAAKGDYAGAAKVYADLSKRLSDDFGIHPNEETREAFRQTARPPEERSMPMEQVIDQLQESCVEPGAMICEYSEFKTLCRARTRVMERSGDETHVALLSLLPARGEPVRKRTMAKLMSELEELLQANLRRGDVIARCSSSQFVVMLVDANYENSCMVCRRLMAAFDRSHLRSNMKVNFIVQPLNTALNMP